MCNLNCNAVCWWDTRQQKYAGPDAWLKAAELMVSQCHVISDAAAVFLQKLCLIYTSQTGTILLSLHLYQIIRQECAPFESRSCTSPSSP